MNKFIVAGRHVPTETDKNPEVFRMTIYAPNEIVASSRFFYHLNQLQKIKRANGEIVSCTKVDENENTVRNFGVWLRYRSRTGEHNMYREIRETTSARAITKLFSDMAGLYRVRYHNVQIMKVVEVPASQCKRDAVVSMIDRNVKFPHPFPKNTLKKTLGKYTNKLPRVYF